MSDDCIFIVGELYTFQVGLGAESSVVNFTNRDIGETYTVNTSKPCLLVGFKETNNGTIYEFLANDIFGIARIIGINSLSVITNFGKKVS